MLYSQPVQTLSKVFPTSKHRLANKFKSFSNSTQNIMSNIEIQYCPYDKNIEENILDQLVVTDCTHPSAITLTHHKGHNNPSDVTPSDSSSGWALNAIKNNNQFIKEKVRYATCNHFDIDGVLSIWVVMNQQEALRWEPVLRHAARIGDFREAALTVKNFQSIPEFQQDGITSQEQVDLALKLCCWMNKLEKQHFSAPFGGVEDDDDKYEYFLPKIGPFLNSPNDFSADWEPEYVEVMNGWQEYLNGIVSVQKVQDISLAIVHAPRQFHYYTLFSLTVGCDYVLTIYPGNKYELESKYTQYVNLYSRPTLPRLNLVPLAQKLNSIETNEIKKYKNLKWDVNRFVDPGPLLQLEDQQKKLSHKERYGHPYDRTIHASSISQENMVDIVISYLRFGSRGQGTKIGDWTWQDLQQINKKIDWDKWNDEYILGQVQ